MRPRNSSIRSWNTGNNNSTFFQFVTNNEYYTIIIKIDAARKKKLNRHF